MLNYSSQLQENNAELQNILDAVNTLPEAGSSGGSANIETCTVTVECDDSLTRDLYVAYSYFNNGSINTNEITLNNSTKQYTIENLVCNSIIYAQTPISYMLSCSVIEGDASKLYSMYNNGYDTLIIKITEAAENPLTILYYDDE